VRKLNHTNALLLTAFLVVPGPALAGPEFETGRTLLDACNAPNLSQHWYCLGYVASIADMHIERGLVCPAPGVSKSDLKRVVTKYLEANPVTLSESASEGVLYALMDAFSCE